MHMRLEKRMMAQIRPADFAYAGYAFGFLLLMVASTCAIALALLLMTLAIPAMRLFSLVRRSVAAVARSVVGMVVIERQNAISGTG